MKSLNELINVAEGTENYFPLVKEVKFLQEQRIIIVGDRLRGLLGKREEVNKEEIINSAKKINEIAKQLGIDFEIGESWNEIETFLRFSIMEDISKEFKNQVNE